LKSKNRIGITLGDPSGIGPEVIAKALAKKSIQKLAHFTIIGDTHILDKYMSVWPKNCDLLDVNTQSPDQFRIGKVSRINGRASLCYLDKAIELIKSKSITGLVTGPVSKEAVSLVNKKFQGHTEYLAEAFHCDNFGMFFVCQDYRVILVTRHLPLKDVSSAISCEVVLKNILLTHTALKKFFHIKSPKIAICGLNPHAGEKGAIGNEEIDIIVPAIKSARRKKIKTFGPFAADTFFAPNLSKDYDAIVAMYHDQGLIALKANYFNTLTNVTIGLPFIRTSPAHGTGFNIAGKNQANPASMCAAIKLAVQLSSK